MAMEKQTTVKGVCQGDCLRGRRDGALTLMRRRPNWARGQFELREASVWRVLRRGMICLFVLFVVAAGGVRPAAAGSTTRVSVSSSPGAQQANNDSIAPSISGNGSLVAFGSDATNL